jgi:hypothetical protein
MLQAFVCEKVGVVVGDLYFLDPAQPAGQEGAEHGVRLELRAFDRGELKGSIYSAVPIVAGRPIWRVDLLETVEGEPGSFDRTHYHVKFTDGWNPTSRVFDRALTADPLGWLTKELSDLPAILDRAGEPRDVADPADPATLRDLAPVIASTTETLLAKVRAGELGLAPAGESADGIRNGWLLSPGGTTPRIPPDARPIASDRIGRAVRGAQGRPQNPPNSHGGQT